MKDEFVYIIDVYDKFFPQDNELYITEINENWYCIRKVKLKWGLPQIEQKIGDDTPLEIYHIYEDIQDALRFLRSVKNLNK